MTDAVSPARIKLRALGWSHARCTAPMQACSDAWERRHPDVELDWESRSLTAFGDEPLEAIAHRYDLILIDHPFCGTAEASKTLVPLSDLLGASVLAALAADSIGPSHASYCFHGRQWALATDAACQVAAVRDDLLDGSPAPVSWDEVLAMAHARPGAVAIPLAPAQAICAFLTLCANAGSPAGSDAGRLVEPGIGVAAIELLGEVFRLGPPGAIAWEPPDVLARLTSSDELAYVPLVFGFATYARTGVRNPCRFLDLPSAGAGPTGSILGGAGLAVTAASVHPHEAAAFAAFASSAEAQRTLVGSAGGQPGSRAAWNAPELDSASGGFFSGTSASIEHAWVRPREHWWPAFQLTGGRILSGALEAGIRPRECFKRLDNLHRDCIAR